MEDICKNVHFSVLTSSNHKDFFNANRWLNEDDFISICKQYGYPDTPITVVIEDYYIDPAYRDIYYNYWSKFHFDWPRHCWRIFLFLNGHAKDDVFGNLSKDFIGTIVVRPSYSEGTKHTFGRTLLDPYKMVSKDEQGKFHPLLKYLKTAPYSVHLLGYTYKIRAFPFASQDGVAMKCAETAIYELCDFASADSAMYARVLPSDIQNSLRQRVPERLLPSRGLYCDDISYILKDFGFSPMIYAEMQGLDRAENRLETGESMIGLIGSDSDTSTPQHEESMDKSLNKPHRTTFKNWFHYYVESGIPLLIVTSPCEFVNRHAALVIGHGERQKEFDACEIYRLGKLPCIDTSSLCVRYIVQDDNQIPYREEEIDKFTKKQNFKLDAFIVPLDRHVFLDASSAASIFDVFIAQSDEIIEDILNHLKNFYNKYTQELTDEEERQQCTDMVDGLTVSEDNPVTVRYYLASSAEFKRFRIHRAEQNVDRIFYAQIPMPKSTWVAEISTYKLYKMGYAFGEVVIDATASNQSKLCGIIMFKMGHLGVYRLPNETYDEMKMRLNGTADSESLTPLFDIFSNFLIDEPNYYQIE